MKNSTISIFTHVTDPVVAGDVLVPSENGPEWLSGVGPTSCTQATRFCGYLLASDSVAIPWLPKDAGVISRTGGEKLTGKDISAGMHDAGWLHPLTSPPLAAS